MILYHCSHNKMVVGEIIPIGKWGKGLIEIGPKHHCWDREMILEFIRLIEFPDKPSRLNATFALDNIETAKLYFNHHCKDGYLYQVEFLDSNPKIHKGDFNAVQPLPNVQENMICMAKKYWEYSFKTNIDGFNNVECSELVINSPLKILKQLVD